MAEKILPTPEQLRQLLDYDPETGKLYWKERPVECFVSEGSFKSWNTKYAGQEAFTATNKKGYKVGSINFSLYRAHRVAWTIFHGKWPHDMLDHINGVRTDNRIKNLRECNNQQNQHNIRVASSPSGIKGVSFDKNRGLWAAKITLNNKNINLGRFKCKHEAGAVYNEASKRLFGEFSSSAELGD